LRSSSYNTITQNNASGNGYIGICISSENNAVIDNSANGNDYHGIYMYYAHNSTISKNTVRDNQQNGIEVKGSTSNTLMSNKVNNSADYGIFLNKSSNNTIYNNYFNNTNNSYDNSNNTWNITKTTGTNIVGGPHLGGNYWSDYDGTDLDGDKLGDTLLPYNSSGSIQNGGDWHPLIIIPKIILKTSKDGYASVQHGIDNDEGFERIEISGNVTDELTTEPIEGADVEIVNGADPAHTTTDADGTYTITVIIPGGSGSDTREDVNFELPPAEYIITAEAFTAELQQVIEANNGTVLEMFDVPDGSAVLILVNVSKEEKIEAFLENVGAVPGVGYIDFNTVCKLRYVPNDPEYPAQWGPQRIQAGGLPNPSAWDWEQGNKNVTIAIIDSGVDYNHPDIAPNYKIGGYDWANEDNDPMDDNGHGTNCAGIAAAAIGNDINIAGLAQCNIIAEKVVNNIGDYRTFDIIRATYHAAELDADVLSMSLGGVNPYNKAEEDAYKYAWHKGCILVAAVGYEGLPLVTYEEITPNDLEPWGQWLLLDEYGYLGDIKIADYPSSHKEVIAVGAIGQNDAPPPFDQNWGPDMELVAPGVGIRTTRMGGGNKTVSGTSFACPHVSGTAALLKSRAKRWPPEPLAIEPWYHLNNKQIRTIMQRTAEDLGPSGWDERYGYGLVDVESALRCVNISGNVLESVFNVPIPHPPGFPPEVRVTSIEGPSGIYTTNENTTLARITRDGDYHVRVPQGVYSICAMAFGYIPSRGLGGERVDLPAFDFMGRLNTEYRNLRLVPFPCRVTGNVTDGVTGVSIRGASVSLDGPPHIYPPHPNVHMDTDTDTGGNYSFILEYGIHPPYPTGEAVYNITVSKDGYPTQTQSFILNWSDVVKDYYKCPLAPNDYDPPIVNFSLPPYLPDLTLTSNDIQFIPPSSDSTASSAVQRTPDITTSYTEKTAAKLLETTKNVRPSRGIIHNQESNNKVSITSSLPSFMIVNLTYPPTVDPNQTFQVTVHTNYTFENTTYVYVGIWDYDASEYIAGTPIPETTLSGSGNTSYTFNLTAPPSGIMELSADLCYWDGYDWIFRDFRDFDVKVGTQSFAIENLTYPLTVNPNQTFQVVVDTNYSFNATTDIFSI
jgi:parallel beta-helix repeat protein